jgi:hypothetical protein
VFLGEGFSGFDWDSFWHTIYGFILHSNKL